MLLLSFSRYISETWIYLKKIKLNEKEKRLNQDVEYEGQRDSNEGFKVFLFIQSSDFQSISKENDIWNSLHIVITLKKTLLHLS